MIDSLFNQPTYTAAKKMLDVTALRHEAIASNLANLETPNYKRIDIAPGFEAQLQHALQSGEPNQIKSLSPSLAFDTTAVPGRDGNSVQLESELVRMNENNLDHALETQLITGNLLRLRLAITGRPS